MAGLSYFPGCRDDPVGYWNDQMHWDHAGAASGGIVHEWTREQGPGGAILLFDDRDIRAEAAGGLADLAHGLAFRSTTAIRYASVSKHFLASLLLSGTSVQLSDTLGQHLMLPAEAGAVTVGRALDMTGGLPDLVETLALLGIASSTGTSRHQLMDACALLDRLNFTPGHEISYSNTGYRLVQAALMAKGTDFPALLRERLFRPLGLSIRLPEDETEPVPGLATGYVRGLRGWRAGRYGMHLSASGGLAGNAVDLASWGQALLGDRAPVPGLLSRLTAPRLLADGQATAYGLGLARTDLEGRALFGHGGSLPGYRSHILLDPQAKAGVVVLCNREDVDAGLLALRVMGALHNVAVAPAAASLLPEGLFVTDTGPFWLQHRAGQAIFMGAAETLIDAGGGWATNRSAALPMRLTAQGGDIVGEVGHVTRHFRPVPPRAAAEPGWAGRYGGYEVTVERGLACLHMPPLGQKLDLRPLDATRAVAQRQDGQQFCVSFAEGRMALATQRARTVTRNKEAVLF